MTLHLVRDLDGLKRRILALGSQVEQAVGSAVTALADNRKELARRVIEGDKAIDEAEVQVEEDCLKILALHQPVAADLRFIITVLKVNNDLERIGDHAGDIAERAISLSGSGTVSIPEELTRMADCACSMVRDGLDALVRLDTGLARRVCRADDEVDGLHRRLFGLLEERMRADPGAIGLQLPVLSVSRHLERVADLATNIAEDVIFQVEGHVVRHRMESMGDEAVEPPRPEERL